MRIYLFILLWTGSAEHPNIDQMASELVMFTNHYTRCTVCAPNFYGYVNMWRCGEMDLVKRLIGKRIMWI